MRHIIFSHAEQYPITLLIKSNNFVERDIKENYVDPLIASGVPIEDVVAFTAEYNEAGKAPAKFIQEYLQELLPILKDLGTKVIYCADANYFKVLTKEQKAEPHWGYALPCAIPGYEGMKVILGLNSNALLYNPNLSPKLDISVNTLIETVKDTYQAPGANILNNVHFPATLEDIKKVLVNLLNYPSLVVDVETFSLNVWKSGIGTITLCPTQQMGIAFAVDLSPDKFEIRQLLKEFFEVYTGKLIMHRGSFDSKVLIYNLWMQHGKDYKGMLEGLHLLFRKLDDTILIAYLATNSTVGNILGLKALAQDFAGNWAVEVTDITKVPLPKLLEYNVIDGLSTNYVYDKYYPKLVEDNQEDIYRNLFLPSLKVITQMELVGMPMNDSRLAEVERELFHIQMVHLQGVLQNPLVKVFNGVLQQAAMEAKNSKLKIKQYPLEHFSNVTLNPNSSPQLAQLLHEQLGLPILDYTDTRQPSVGGDTLKKLLNYTTDPDVKDLLTNLIEYKKVVKINDTFIPAFKNGWLKQDGYRWLHGCFNLGGTVSGRLSSSDPNMQNLPANSAYGKTIKTIFQAPPGWLFCGADFASLEDRINALLTKDPNKLKVYTDGFDGHCLRALAYFGDEMQGIDPNSVQSVNSIADVYPKLRQESKTPTFALTYLGTWRTLMKNLGWLEEKAKKVENSFRALYKASEDWVKAKIIQAAKDGYCEVAFGLRVRTPLLKRSILGNSATPAAAEAEARTLGNAVSGQSYGLLNSRAMNEVMEKVWNSPYAEDILPVAQIHDAGYYMIRDDVNVVAYANKLITEAMSWQKLPEIQHPDVKLFANLDIFHPDWSKPITLPSTATPEEIYEICQNTLKEHATKVT